MNKEIPYPRRQFVRRMLKSGIAVAFGVLAKIEVNGENAHPLYVLLKKKSKGLLGTEGIKWNFTKFLVGRDGSTITRYSPATPPDEIRADLEKALGG